MPAENAKNANRTLANNNRTLENNNRTAENSKRYLETVTVTAKRSETPLADLTTSVTPLDTETLERLSADHMHQLFQNSPGTWVSRGSGQEHLTAIRSPVFTGPGACGAFQMSQDGIPLRAAGFCNANQLFDSHYEAAAGIEIQRGPNSALYGSNALFGSIDLQLPQPETSDARVQWDTSALTSDTRARFNRLHLALPVQLNGSLLTLATMTDNRDERDSAGYNQQKLSLRHQTTRGEANVLSGFSIAHLDQQTAGYIPGKDAYQDDDLRLQNLNPEAYRNALSATLFSRWQWQRQQHHWSATPYVRVNEMEFLMHFVPWQPVETNGHHSAGLQLQHQHRLNNTVNIRSGIDGELTHAYLQEIQEHPAPFAAERFPVGRHYDYRVNAQSLALYSGLDWTPTAAWLWQVSVRGDYQAYDYHTRVTAGSACEPQVENCRFYRPQDRRDHFQHVSASAGVRYRLRDNHQLYAALAQGFRAPQAAELYRLQQGQQTADLEAVELNSADAGVRGSLPRGHYQLGVFWMAMDNGIFQNTERANISGAQTRHRGVEYEWFQTLTDSWSLRLSGTWAEHTYHNNPDLLESSATDPRTIAGNLIDTAPRNVHSGVLSWQWRPQVRFHLEVEKLGPYFLDPQNRFRYPGHQLANLRLQWSLTDALSLQLNILNLEDKRYADRADVAFGEYRYFPGQSRKLLVSIQLDNF